MMAIAKLQNRTLKDYRESDTAANNAAVMQKTIEFMIHDLKKKTHKYKEDIV